MANIIKKVVMPTTITGFEITHIVLANRTSKTENAPS